jgi:hypothetical protein
MLRNVDGCRYGGALGARRAAVAWSCVFREKEKELMKVQGQWVAAAMLLCTAASCLRAEGFTSGIPVGDPIGSYSCTKSGGADDGIDVGKSLCYT